jgi:Tfp pilus assembly protein PilF
MENEVEELVKQAIDKALGYFQKEDFQNAEKLYKQILRVDEDNEKAHHMLSLAITQTGRHEEAKEAAKRAIKKYPKKHEFWNNLGLIHGFIREHKEAIKCFKKAIKLKNEVFLYSNLAIEYKKINKISLCEKTFRRGIETDPNHDYTRFNYAATLLENGRLLEAKEQYLEAIRCNPELTAAQYSISACYFLLGRYREGWRQYEWRWKQFPRFAKKIASFKKSFWNGEDLKGKSIMLYSEQGIGDIFHFIRFAKFLKEMGATIYLECPFEASEVLTNCEWIDKICCTTDYPEFDYHCSLLSIPCVLMKLGYSMTVKDLSTDFPYIKPSGKVSEDWNKYKNMFKIGIVWGGNPQHPNDCNRSCYLKYFQPLTTIPNVKLFSLQKDLRQRDWAGKEIDLTEGSEGLPIIDLSKYLTTFNHTALIIKQMDILVTVDTAIAHLAGAMGKLVYVLLPTHRDWRWIDDNGNTPWYPSMKLIKWAGNWETSINNLLNKIKHSQSQ